MIGSKEEVLKIARNIVFPVVTISLLSCGGSGDDASDTVVFSFRIRGLAAAEEFRVATSSPQLITQARAQLALPESQRSLFASGALRAGNAGHNLGWSWHLEDVELTQTAIELCDGRPSMVEANLDYWLSTVKRFCPWGAYVHAER